MCVTNAYAEACAKCIIERAEAKQALKLAEVRILQLEGALEWAIRHLKVRCHHGELCPVVAVAQENLGRVVPIKKARTCACGQREKCSADCQYVWDGRGPNSDIKPHSETSVS